MPKAKLKINELISLVEISRHSNVDSVMWLLIIVLYRFTMKKRKPGKRNKKNYILCGEKQIKCQIQDLYYKR